MECVVAETELLILRELEEGDLENLYSLIGHPEVMRFSIAGPYTKQETKEFIQKCRKSYRDKGAGLYGVILKEQRTFIGYCGFSFLNIRGEEEVEIGYYLLPEYWNRGFATDASRAVRDLGLKKHGYKRLISLIDRRNTASKRVAEKTGMIPERTVMYENISLELYSLEVWQRTTTGIKY